MRGLPLPRFWKITRVAFKRPSLPAVARAWAGFEEEPEKAEVSPDEVKALREALG